MGEQEEQKGKLADWLPAAAAAEIVSRNSGREVSAAYMRSLVVYGKLRVKRLSAHIVLYSRFDAERIIVAHRGGKTMQVHDRRSPSMKKGQEDETEDEQLLMRA